MQTVPTDIYEAGDDRRCKSGWQKFWKLTFPMLLPFISINLILSTKNMLMVFDQIMSLTKGGPAQSTESISYLIYQQRYGQAASSAYQCANAVIFFIVIVAFSAVVQLKLTGKKEEQL
ncbi:MAG: carbohydrate ABC transporter permease [Ruminococcus sp.]